MKLGEDITAVWLPTNARTGSMWATNVVREVVRAQGLRPVPDEQLQDDDAIAVYGMRHVMTRAPGVAVLKVHRPIPPIARSVGIITQRDVRDAMMSYMRFTRSGFERAIVWAQHALSYRPEMFFQGEPRLVLPYQVIRDDPRKAVGLIATFLGADGVNDEDIATRLDKKAVHERIRRVEAEIAAANRSGGRVDPRKLVTLAPGNRRAFDLETGFQTGHVSNYHDGDWRNLLSVEQQARVEKVIAAAGRDTV